LGFRTISNSRKHNLEPWNRIIPKQKGD
jgi:hypothetical protein